VLLQPNFAFRKRTTIGLSRVQKARKTQRPESVFPPEFENGGYYDAHTAGGADNAGADMDDNDLYVNARSA